MRPRGRARNVLLAVLLSGSTALSLAVGAPAPLPREEPRPDMGVDQLVLRDVHPLFGGRNLYLDRQGRGVLQVVERSPVDSQFRDQRYRVALSAKSAETLARVLKAQNFLRGGPPGSRAGIPDESRITLQLTLSPDEVVTVTKWSGQNHEPFDAVYQALLALIPEIRRGPSAAAVPYDPAWVPEGFKRP
jgi:hypothetical protein